MRTRMHFFRCLPFSSAASEFIFDFSAFFHRQLRAMYFVLLEKLWNWNVNGAASVAAAALTIRLLATCNCCFCCAGALLRLFWLGNAALLLTSPTFGFCDFVVLALGYFDSQAELTQLSRSLKRPEQQQLVAVATAAAFRYSGSSLWLVTF